MHTILIQSKTSSKKRLHFYGYFGVLLNLTIVMGALLWIAYGHLPGQYYLPVSFAVIVLTGFVAFFILNYKMRI